MCLFAIFGSHAQYAINQRIAAEKRLRESEKRYRSIIETTPDGYFEVDIDGNFTYFNDAMCDILGYSRVEMSGMNHIAYLDESESSKVMDALHHVYKTGEAVTIWGESEMGSIEALEVAEKIGTIAYEVTCGVSRRVQRVYIGET